jgi:VanZ family protein
MSRLTAWRAVFAAAVVVSLVIALKPGTPGPDWFLHADKLRHAAGFLVLWLLGVRAGLRPAAALAVGLLAFGAAIELLQGLTPDRQPSWGDLLADGAGVALGALLRRPG